MRRHGVGLQGLTFVELIICLVILGNLVLLAVPAGENTARRLRELSASERLREMRRAIDRYQDDRLRKRTQGDIRDSFPRSLEELVRERYLRRVPVDPLTGRTDWIGISTTDRFDGSAGFVSDRHDVLDVRTRARGVTLEGIDYGDL